MSKTIAVVLTPPGAGAIGVIRLAGPDGAAIVAQHFRPVARPRKGPAGPSRVADEIDSPVPNLDEQGNGRLRYGTWNAPDEVIDEVLVSRASGTADQSFDISCHGGVRIVERILETLEHHGAEIADPFSRIAEVWLATTHIEQEILEALCRAKTQRAAEFLARQRELLPAAISEVASLCRTDASRAKQRVAELLDGLPQANRLVLGAEICVIGPTNSGKSTLVNALAGRSVSIESPVHGTTWDWVSVAIEFDGVPLTLLDTAGGRTAAGPTERVGVEAGWQRARQADLCLLLCDGSTRLPPVDDNLCMAARLLPNLIPVRTKHDLGSLWNSTDRSAGSGPDFGEWAAVSARTGEGMETLCDRILDELGFTSWSGTLPHFFSDRQAAIAERLLKDLPLNSDAAELAIRSKWLGA